MVGRRILLAVGFLVIDCLAHGEIPVPKCGNISNITRSWNMSIKSEKNESGDWVTTFSAWKDSKSSLNGINLDVSHRVFDCDEKRIVFIQGILNDLPVEESLHFHPKCGRNVAISNDGRSVQKINSSDHVNGVVFTKRPLNVNELFEVRLDERITNKTGLWAIGITLYKSGEIDIPKQMYLLKFATWMMYNDDVYTNGTLVLNKYSRNINRMQVGDRIGVLRNNYGALHFFVNGVDQGPAASNIPYPVYGAFELWGAALKATIVSKNEN